jgi:hypothetical protein
MAIKGAENQTRADRKTKHEVAEPKQIRISCVELPWFRRSTDPNRFGRRSYSVPRAFVLKTFLQTFNQMETPVKTPRDVAG